jgi:hypothetical protein
MVATKKETVGLSSGFRGQSASHQFEPVQGMIEAERQHERSLFFTVPEWYFTFTPLPRLQGERRGSHFFTI